MRELFRESRQRGDGLSADVREEIRLHIELRAEQLIARGVSREEAYARAQAMFGPVEQVERELYWSARKANRAMRASEWLKTVVQDGAYALRTLRRQRGFAVAAVLTLALGIGASAAIYSLVDATMLARFPFADADELRVIWGVFGPECVFRPNLTGCFGAS